MANITAGRWALQAAPTEKVEDAETLPTGGLGAVLPGDHRTVVSVNDIKDGGKYRAIVKLQIQYEKSEKWYMATGYLIAADTVVTAGHCVYDWANNLQRALYIKAWIGYNGKDAAATTTNRQYRYGSMAVTTSGWLMNGQNVINDVALVKLNDLFTGTLNIITYVGTPLKGSETLGVVGYPGDKELNGEWGAQAYQEYDPVDWDLDTGNHMLEYAISTYGGNSGSPVLRRQTDLSQPLVSIATHHGSDGPTNCGSPVAGTYGNPYDSYKLAFDATTVRTVDNIQYVNVQDLPSPVVAFKDALSAVATFGDVPDDFLPMAAPFIDPVACPLAALYGGILARAGAIADANMGAQASVTIDQDCTGFTERGIIAEAAIQTVLDFSVKVYEDLDLSSKLETAYNNIAPAVHGIGPQFLSVVMQPGVSIGCDFYQKLKSAAEGSTDSTPKPLTHPSVPDGTDDKTVDFLNRMWQDTVEVSGEDWFFNQLGTVIYNAIINNRTIADFAPGGLCVLSTIAAAQGFDLPQGDTELDFQNLTLRVILGEAALQAFIACDLDKLQKADGFNKLKQNAQYIGRAALKTSVWVNQNVPAVIVGFLTGQNPKRFDTAAPDQADTIQDSTSDKAAAVREIMRKKAALDLQAIPSDLMGKNTVKEMLVKHLEKTVLA